MATNTQAKGFFNGFVPKRVAWRHGISRLRLEQAIKNGEVAVLHCGLNGRVKVRESDVLRILAGGLPAPDLKTTAEGKAA